MKNLFYTLLLIFVLVIPPPNLTGNIDEPTQKQITAITLSPKEFLQTEVERQGLTPKDFAILTAIIQCESTWAQKYPDGTVKVSNGNIGLMQINRYAHESEYNKMWLDPFDERDNLIYGVLLYKRNGIRDWEAWSGHCFLPLLAKQGITFNKND